MPGISFGAAGRQPQWPLVFVLELSTNSLKPRKSGGICKNVLILEPRRRPCEGRNQCEYRFDIQTITPLDAGAIGRENFSRAGWSHDCRTGRVSLTGLSLVTTFHVRARASGTIALPPVRQYSWCVIRQEQGQSLQNLTALALLPFEAAGASRHAGEQVRHSADSFYGASLARKPIAPG